MNNSQGTRESNQGFPTKLLGEEKRTFHEGYFGNFLGICKYIDRIESDRNLSLKTIGTWAKFLEELGDRKKNLKELRCHISLLGYFMIFDSVFKWKRSVKRFLIDLL